LLPLTGAILAGSTLYDNFRQFLFILPALFILAGMALDELFNRINAAWLKALVLGIVVLPGILAGVSLHPYEYTYYNNLVGGTGGAFRRFETDYWGTSFAEAANYINQTAPLQASVFVSGPDEIFRRDIRPDIKIVTVDNVRKQGGRYDYLVTLTRWNKDLLYCPQGKTIFTVERDKAIFTVIKQVSNNRAGCP
jgi:hypothetical protein